MRISHCTNTHMHTHSLSVILQFSSQCLDSYAVTRRAYRAGEGRTARTRGGSSQRFVFSGGARRANAAVRARVAGVARAGHSG